MRRHSTLLPLPVVAGVARKVFPWTHQEAPLVALCLSHFLSSSLSVLFQFIQRDNLHSFWYLHRSGVTVLVVKKKKRENLNSHSPTRLAKNTFRSSSHHRLLLLVAVVLFLGLLLRIVSNVTNPFIIVSYHGSSH